MNCAIEMPLCVLASTPMMAGDDGEMPTDCGFIGDGDVIKCTAVAVGDGIGCGGPNTERLLLAVAECDAPCAAADIAATC